MTRPEFTRRAALATGLAVTACPGAVWAQSRERDLEGGIGGTGIVGIVTGTDGLIVAGSALRTDGQTDATDAFGPIALADLRRGDSLTVEASTASNALVARRVHLTYPLVGSVTAVSENGRAFVVNGVEVRAERATGSVSVGDRVAVSGLWREKQVVASRVVPTRQTRDLIAGDVLRGFSGTRIGPVVVRGVGVSGLSSGSYAEAIGRFDAARGRFQVQSVDNARFTGAAGALTQLAIEGYLEPADAAPGYRIAGLGHSFERNLRLAPYAQARVLFTGPYTGRFAANKAYKLPDDLEARRLFLQRLSETST